MTNGYDFLKYKPESYKQINCKDMLFVYYDCPQVVKRVDIFAQYNTLSFIIKGKKITRQLGKSLLLGTCECYFFKKGEYNQGVYLNEGWHTMYIHISDAYLHLIIKEYLKFYNVNFSRNQFIGHIINLDVNQITKDFYQIFTSTFSQRPSPLEEVLEERFRELFFSILTNHNNQSLVCYLIGLIDRPKTSLFETMESNYMYNLPLQEYAKISNRSLATFKREFKHLFHTTPGKWLMDKRLNYAQLLINTTKKNIAEIVFDSGFENNSHFSRVFKEKFGASPFHYRKEHLQPNSY